MFLKMFRKCISQHGNDNEKIIVIMYSNCNLPIMYVVAWANVRGYIVYFLLFSSLSDIHNYTLLVNTITTRKVNF